MSTHCLNMRQSGLPSSMCTEIMNCSLTTSTDVGSKIIKSTSFRSIQTTTVIMAIPLSAELKKVMQG